MPSPLALLWLIVLWLPALSQAQTLELASCDTDRIILQPWLQVHEDAHGDYTLDDFLGVASTESGAMNLSHLRPGITSAALWLRFEVINSDGDDCRMWLFPAAPRARDMRLFEQSEGHWQQRLAGADWPLAQWDSPLRLPAFELHFPGGQSSTFILRMGNWPPVAMQPMLLSHDGLLRARMAESTADGVVLGIVGLLVVLSLAVGFIYRLPVLFAHATAVLLYMVYVALQTGYGFVHLWPDAPAMDKNLVILTRATMGVAVLGYLRLLLQVRRLPRRYGHVITGWQSFLVICGLAQIALGVVLSNTVSWAISGVSALLMLAMMWLGYRHRLPYNWFCYLLPSLLAFQALVQGGFILKWWELSPYEYSWYSISTLPGAFLLVYTLVSEVRKGRTREKRALLDIDQLKQTERERLEHTVAVRTSQLRNALSAQNHLLARISHDLRTPIQGILNAARHLGVDGERHQQAHHIEQNARLQLELIDELLEFSRNELQHMELLIAPGYLFGFLREVEEMGHFLAERNHNRFSCVLADDLPLLVNADFRRLRQLLVNLLANATKFTHNGVVEFRISLVGWDEQGQAQLEFTIEDSGIGIPPGEMARLTQPFQRASNASRHEGTGLGLYIVKQMLEQMGSRMHIGRSSLGGSLFSFPLKLEVAVEQELETILEESHLLNFDGEGKRILVVDDADISCEMLYELLSGYGYDVHTCSGVDEAWAWLAGEQPDLVLCDQYMPHATGWILLSRIRQRWPGLPVVLHSASPPRPPEEYEHLAFDASVLKPAQSDRLVRLIGITLSKASDSSELSEESQRDESTHGKRTSFADEPFNRPPGHSCTDY